MKKYRVKIEGITPLLMNRPSNLIGDLSKNNLGNDSREPREQATDKLYELKGKLYQPATHFEGAMVEAGKHKKVVGKGKSNYSKIIGYSITIEPEAIIHRKQKWEVFDILAVNPNTKGRYKLHRPRLEEWELIFDIEFDEQEVPVVIVKELLDIAGRKVGIGDWRPAKKGRFGKFHITEWKEI